MVHNDIINNYLLKLVQTHDVFSVKTAKIKWTDKP